MRNINEIEAAHDRLVAILTYEVPNPFGQEPDSIKRLIAAADVLCWVLRHDHNQSFADNLRKIDEWLHARGYRIEPLLHRERRPS